MYEIFFVIIVQSLSGSARKHDQCRNRTGNPRCTVAHWLEQWTQDHKVVGTSHDSSSLC